MKVEFIKGITGTNGITEEERPHIAFIGRSNVGKSSTLNALFGKSMAHVSKTAGKTREINFFLVDDKVYFIDLPGYGYARLSAKLADKLRKRIIWYFTESEVKPKITVLILDAKVGITPLDEDMLDILEEEGHRVLVVFNKVDKLNQKELHHAVKKLENDLLGRNIKWDYIPFSAKKGKGKNTLLEKLGV